jgi:hypothetical protein
MTNRKHHTAGRVPKYNRKVVERDKIDTLTHNCMTLSLSCLGTGTSIKSGGVKLVLWAQ